MQKDRNTDNVYISYSSPKTNTKTYVYNLKSKKKRLVKEQIIPSGHSPENYITERLECISHDGRMIPLTITRHKKTKLQAMPHFNYHNHMIPSSDRKLLEEMLGEITHEKLKEMTLKEIYNSKNLDNWEMTYEVPMKYNRMVMYPASYFHSMALNLDTMFNNNWRIIQSCMFG